MGLQKSRLPQKGGLFHSSTRKRKEAIVEDSLFFENEKPRETYLIHYLTLPMRINNFKQNRENVFSQKAIAPDSPAIISASHRWPMHTVLMQNKKIKQRVMLYPLPGLKKD